MAIVYTICGLVAKRLSCYTAGMGLYVRRDEQRTKLQEKIAADLRSKAAENAKSDIEGPKYDGAEDAGIVEDTHTSSPLLGVWLVIGLLVVGVVVYLIVQSS